MRTTEAYGEGVDGSNTAAQPWETRPASDHIDLAWLFHTFRRRIWVFVITIAATLAAVILFMVLFPPLYQATARITINQRQLSAQPDKESAVVASLPAISSNVDTEAQVVQSRRVAQIVVDRLGLANDREFNPRHKGLRQSTSDFFNALLHPAKTISTEDRVIDAVLANLDPERYLETNAIDINFRDNDAAKAQRIANAFAQAYLDAQVASKLGQNNAVISAMGSQLEAMREQAASDSQRVGAYKVAHNLLSASTQQTLTEHEITGFDQDVANAKAEAAADEANLKTAQEQLARGSSGEDVAAALNSSVVTQLRSQKAQLSDKLAYLESHYGPKYPDLAQARRQVANIDLEIQAEILRDIANLSAKSNVSKQRLASLEATRNATRGSLAADGAAQAGLDDLVRAQTVSQAVYEAYLQRFQEAVAQLKSIEPDADIVSVAGLPSAAWFPDPLLFPALGVVAAFLFGCAGVLLAEMLDTRIRTPGDVERRLGRYLGGIPLNASGAPLNAVVHSPRGDYGEAFRGLLASIAFASPKAGPNVVVITSARSGDGKTIVSAGLARTSALLSGSAVIIDCGSRDPARTLTRVLRITDPGPGLAGVLRGEAPLEAALRTDEPSGAAVIPIGDSRTPPDGLMGGEAMDALLAELRRRYDLIVLDAPALSIATSRTLAAKSDVTVIVVPWGSKPEGPLEEALGLPPLDRLANIGFVLNRVVEARPAKRFFADLMSSDPEPTPRPNGARAG